MTIPVGKQEPPVPPKPEQSGLPGPAEVARTGVAYFSFPVFAISVVVLAPIYLPVIAVGDAKGRGVQSKRAGIDLGMSRDTVEQNLGPPTVEIALPGSDTQVLAYVIGDWSLNFAGNWYAGVRDGQVVWTHIIVAA